MNTPHKASHSRSFTTDLQAPRGFALIATISVMTLLVMVALAMLSLSTIEIRQSQNSSAKAAAQANARMAAMIALGDLQRYLGPDQRVTANAAIHDTSPQTAQIDGVANPHWVAAYKTTFGADDDPMIYPVTGEGGYLKDRRGNSSFNHKEQVLKYLVSGVNANDHTVALTNAANGVKLVSGVTPSDEIYVPKVKTADGAYAYHIKDVGMSAPIFQHNPNAGVDIDQTASGVSALYTGSHRPYNIIDELNGSLDHLTTTSEIQDDASEFKYLTLPQSELLSGDLTKTRAALRQFVNDLDIPGEALMVDTVNSGFKVDLTSYVKDVSPSGSATLTGEDGNGSPFLLLQDTTPIIDVQRPRFNMHSPKFGILRSYANLGSKVSNGVIDPTPPKMGAGKESAYPSYENFVQSPVHPYITDFSVYFSIVADPGASSGLSVLYYPRVTLYNPHNVTLSASNYFVQINRNLKYFIAVSGQRSPISTDHLTIPGQMYQKIGNGNDPASSLRGYLGFYLDPVSIAPGEALVFTPKERLAPMTELSGNVTQNVLSATVSQNSKNAFYRHLAKHWAPSPKYDPNKGDGRFAFTGWVHFLNNTGDMLSARLRLNTNESSSQYAAIANSADFPIVHTLDAQNWKRGNEGRWYSDGQRFPIGNIADLNSALPINRVAYGLRLKILDESLNAGSRPNDLWREATINNYNLRSGVHRRTPWDYLQHVNGRFHEFSFGAYTTDGINQPDYTSALFQASYKNGRYRYSPLLGSAGNGVVMPLFDVPSGDETFYSIGQFRSAQLTQIYDHPSFILGESLAPRSTPRGQTAQSESTYNATWNAGLRRDRISAYATWWDADLAPEDHYDSYDVRYETNHALWDRYFFSTYDGAAAAGSQIENPRHILTDEVLEIAANRIAKYIRLKGHFNVNSTSVIAWKSILMLNAGADVNGKSTGPKEFPFPGMVKVTEGMQNGSGDSNFEGTWNGYRALSETEAQELAEAIVAQVKRRAPFIGVGDFVNRRLIETATPNTAPVSQTDEEKLSYAGAIEVAIMDSNLNSSLQDYQPVFNTADLDAPPFGVPAYDQGNQPSELFHGAGAHVSQGKILQTIGSMLTARSDTFKIRAYGEATDANDVTVTAVCELVVQRSIHYVDKTDSPNKSVDELSEINKKFGRKFEVVSFKWLTSEQ